MVRSPNDISPKNQNYQGVSRIPAYPSDFEEENPILDDYVFADYKSLDTNLIPTYDKAVELWKRLSISRRQFDVIAWCVNEDDPLLETVSQAGARWKPLGFDVAGIGGDHWSIVEDSSIQPWARRFLRVLNDHGLFEDREIADEYLREYIRNREADWDIGFQVGLVVQVEPPIDDR